MGVCALSSLLLGKMVQSRDLTGCGTVLDIDLMPDIAQSRENIAASNYHAAKRRTKSKQEVTWQVAEK